MVLQSAIVLNSAAEAKRLTNEVKDHQVKEVIQKRINSGYLFAVVNKDTLRPEFKEILSEKGYKFAEWDDHNTTILWE